MMESAWEELQRLQSRILEITQNNTVCVNCGDQSVYARGLCQKCYASYMRNGDFVNRRKVSHERKAEIERQKAAKKEFERVQWRKLLVRTVFGYDLQEYPPDFEESVDFVLDTMLAPKERSILLSRIRDKVTLRELSEKYGVTRERIRQIELRAFRLLRHPSRAIFLKYGRSKVPEILDEQKNSLPLDNFGFSVRARNCLMRAGCDTIDDVTELYNSGDLQKVRNLGQKCFCEIESKLRECGKIK